MSDLIVAAFDSEAEAENVRAKLLGMQKTHLVELEDAALAIKTASGKVKLRQTHNLPLAGAASGTFWGLLIGLLFAAPLAGALVGAGAGAVSGALADIGVDDVFMRNLGEALPAGGAALFVLVKKATPDKVIAELRPFTGRILQTSLSSSDEAELRAALERADSLTPNVERDATTP